MTIAYLLVCVAIGNRIIAYILSEYVEKKLGICASRTINLLKMSSYASYDEKIVDCSGRAPKPTINIEHTLAIIKPDAMHKAHEIEDIILKSGFTIINVRYTIDV